MDNLAGTPPGHRLVGQQALAIAAASGKVEEALKDHPKAKPEVFLKGPNDWQVSWFTPGTGDDRKEIAQVRINDRSAKIVEAWNGPQVAWTMARGYPGAFGRKVNSPWVWIPLTVLFLAPFLRGRPRWLCGSTCWSLAAFGLSVALLQRRQPRRVGADQRGVAGCTSWSACWRWATGASAAAPTSTARRPPSRCACGSRRCGWRSRSCSWSASGSASTSTPPT